jgi:hypothetical protein
MLTQGPLWYVLWVRFFFSFHFSIIFELEQLLRFLYSLFSHVIRHANMNKMWQFYWYLLLLCASSPCYYLHKNNRNRRNCHMRSLHSTVLYIGLGVSQYSHSPVISHNILDFLHVISFPFLVFRFVFKAYVFKIEDAQ